MKKRKKQSVEHVWLWEKGEVLDRNEDVICIRSINTAQGVCALYAVFDGMGGYEGGGEAAALAGWRTEEWFSGQVLTMLKEISERPFGGSLRLYRRLIKNSGCQLFDRINEELFRRGKRDRRVYGCTASVCLVWQETVYWFHVGDSGIFCSKRKGGLVQTHRTPDGRLYRCLGANRDSRMDFGSRKLSKDLYLICSDGFLEKIEWNEVRESLLSCKRDKKQLEKRLKKIGEYQRLRMAEDNSSAILFWRGR